MVQCKLVNENLFPWCVGFGQYFAVNNFRFTMDVTDLDIRKPKGRKSRNNSGNSRDPKSENKKEANGNAEENETNQDSLPNGDERPLGSVKSDENVEDNGEEERSTPKAKPTSSDIVQCAKITVSNPKTNKSKAYLKRNSKIQPHNNSNDSEEEFMGFDSDGDLDSDSPLSVMMKLIDKYEKMQPVSNDEFSDEEEEYCQPSQEYSSDAYCSGASSPTKMDGLHDVLGIDEVCSSTASSPSVASGFSGDGRPRGKKSHHVDLANPAFRKPLEMGWRRELVFRKMSDNSNKRQADVYYYTPSGKKVRSAREVIEHLSGTDLTEENFTFFKVALGLNDPTKEIIRDAKVRESSGTPPQKIPKLSKALKPGGISKSREESASSPNITKNFSRGAFPRIKVTPGRGNQHSSPGRPRPVGRPKKDSLPIADGELEIGMLPPSWKEPSAVSGSRKMSGTPGGKVSGQAMGGKAVSKEDGYTGTSDGHFMQFFMQNVSVGYTALHHVFQYLKVHELLRAGRVCRMWHDLAGHPSLWRTVRMKNSQVLDWDGCADTLSTHGTRHLDLRKMLLDTSKSKEVWNQFCTAIGRISSLRHLDLCRCPTSVVERVAAKCPQLTNLTALFLSDPNLDLKSLKSLTQLEELRLKGVNGLKLKSSLDVLKDMTSLKHLSLTMVKDLGKSCPENLKSLTQLESLELGECNDVSEAFGTECLPRLKKLTRLRLEMGQMKCPTFVILDGVHSLPSLTHLELVNFDIKPGFDKALAQCTNIKRLLLIPTYLTQSATTNHMVLGGVTKLSDNLVQFVWGVTHELLHVTELFVDQCEGQKGVPKGPPGGPNPLQPPSGKKPGDSIPILRPVPGRDILGAGDVKLEEDDTSKPSPQVDILPLSRLQKLLSTSLPKTNVNILKIPFSATWRQTLGETGH